jgi:hypothetical protein
MLTPVSRAKTEQHTIILLSFVKPLTDDFGTPLYRKSFCPRHNLGDMIETIMKQTEKIEDEVSRLTSEQSTLLLRIAKLLVEGNSGQDISEIVAQSI